MNRGQLTDELSKFMSDFLGRETTLAELRLIPYVQYVMVNYQKIDPSKVNAEEREILRKWREAGHIEGGASGLSITREFWDFMCSVLFQSYVAIGAE